MHHYNTPLSNNSVYFRPLEFTQVRCYVLVAAAASHDSGHVVQYFNAFFCVVLQPAEAVAQYMRCGKTRAFIIIFFCFILEAVCGKFSQTIVT